MKKLWLFVLVVLCFTIISTGFAAAATSSQVYLNDGAIIECQKVWKAKGKVMVLINRDVLLDFPRAEVDLQKTFGAKSSAAKVKKKQIKQAPFSKRLQKKKPEVITNAAASEGTPVPAAKQTPVAKAGVPAPPAKPATPARPAQAAPPEPPSPPVTKAAVVPAPAVKAVPAVQAVAAGAATQAAPSSTKVAATVPQPPKPAPRPPIKFVPPPPPPEPFYTNPLVLQAGGGGVLIILLAVLLVMRKKKA